MEDSIKKIKEQFDFEPEIINGEKILEVFDNFVIGGMGGSHLAGGVLQQVLQNKNISIHRDYGIPEKYLNNSKNKTLFIASSYSGNTEEVLDFADEIYSRGLELIIITKGGALLDFAQKNNVAHIILPNASIQPRMALIYSLIAMTKVIEPTFLHDVYKIKQEFSDEKLEKYNKLAEDFVSLLKNKTPIIYTSSNNRPVAYNWKIKFNETAKIPAFYNSIPELNHNEMQGFDFNQENQNLTKNFCFIFIKNSADDFRILKRFKILEDLYQEKGYLVITHEMFGQSLLLKILNTIILADFISLKLANFYKTDPEQVEFIEKFKKIMLK
jgi:glucose/mannose-6-phosphate isomerase